MESTAKRLEAIKAHLESTITGLRGSPEDWSETKRKRVKPVLEKFGLTLVTRNAAQQMGYRIRDDAAPIARAYYPAPIGRYCDLFLLELHFEKSERPAKVKRDPRDIYDEKAQAQGFDTWRDMLIAVYEGRAKVERVTQP